MIIGTASAAVTGPVGIIQITGEAAKYPRKCYYELQCWQGDTWTYSWP